MRKPRLTSLGRVAVFAAMCAGTAAAQAISGFNPATVAAGGNTFTLTVTGSGLDSANVLSWTDPGSEGAVAIPFTASGNPGQFTVSIPAARIANPGTATLQACTGSLFNCGSNFASFPIRVRPTLTSLQPTSILAGAPGTTLVLNGSQFTGFDQVNFNGTILQATGGDSTLTVSLPAALIQTPGVYNVFSFDSAAGAQTATLQFTALGPTTSSISPTSTTLGSGSVAMTITGTNFGTPTFGSPTVLVGGSTAVAPSSTNGSPMSVTIPGTALNAVGTTTIAVQNFPSGGPVSNPQTFTVYALPVVTSAVPTSINYNVATPITVNGAFNVGDQIVFGGTTLATTGTTSQLHATVPASLLQTYQPVSVQVINPANSLSSSSATVNVIPVISSLNPNNVNAGAAQFTLTVNLTGGFPSFSTPQVTFNGNTINATFVNSSTITATIPANLVTTAAVVPVSVTSLLSALTESSAPVNFTINTAVLPPTLTSVIPGKTPAGRSTTISVTGQNFVSGDTIQIGPTGCTTLNCLTPLTTTFNSATSMSASLPGSVIASQGDYSVFVSTSANALSSALPLTTSLQITGVSPSSVEQGSTPLPTLVVTSFGGFTVNSVIVLNGQSLTTVFDSPTQVEAALTTPNLSVAGTYPVTVQNPEFPASNQLKLTITPSGSISSINPSSVFAGAGDTALTVTGSNFSNTGVIHFGSSVLSTTFVNAQTLTATIPTALLTNAGSFPITVVDGSNVTTNAFNFTVTLEITGLSPQSVIAGGPAFNLTATLTGGVTSNTVLNYGGTPLQTVSTTATSITATVPANLITVAATPPVFAVDGSNQSNTVNHLVLGPLTLISISPTFVDAGTNGLQLTLTGTGFTSGSVVSVNGTAVPTLLSNGGLLAQVPANLLTTPGTAQVTVTNSGSQTSNSLPLQILTPLSLSSLNPSKIGAGSPQFSLTVTGAGFDSSTVVIWTGGDTSELTTVFVSANQVTAIVPASLVSEVGTAQVSVTDSRERSAGPLTFSILPPVTLSSINPSTAPAGTAISLTLNGSGFGASAPVSVLFGSNSIAATSTSDSQVSVIVPSGFNLTVGTVQVAVVTSGGLSSNSLPFNATNPNTNPNGPAPVITGINPTNVNVLSSGVVLTVSGSFFQSGAVIEVNGSGLSTTFVNSGTLTATLPPFNGAGPRTITVVNPDFQSSNGVTLTVGSGGTGPTGPTSPTLTSISPAAVAPGGPGFTLTANGTGFQSGAVINFGASALQATFVSSNQLTAVVPPNLVASVGSVQVTVTNPDAAPTNSLTFLITTGPLVTSLAPSSVSAGAIGFSLSVSGSGFQNGANVYFGGTQLTTAFVSSSQLTATVPANLVATAGPIAVVVTNPDSSTSNSVTFTVNSFTVTSITPPSVPTGSGPVTITVTGTGFGPGTTVSINGTPLTTTFVNTTTVTAVIPGTLLTNSGSAIITVTNPDGATVTTTTFSVQPTLTVVSVNPTTIPANSPATLITVTGTGFVDGAQIIFNGVAIPTTFVSGTSLTGTVPPTQLTQVGVVLVTVTNPNGATSNPVNFSVGAAAGPPVILSVAPATAFVGAAATPVTITGTGFVQGSAVQFNGGATSTQFVNGTQLTALLSVTQLSQPGVFPIVVVNPDASQSNSVNFTVVTPLTITTLDPSAVLQSTGDTVVTITGAGIVTGATVLVGTTPLTATFNSSTSLTVTIPAAQFAAAGPLSITVKNPDGTVSNALPFDVVPLPEINLSTTITAAGTNQVIITVSSPAPATLTGTLTLSFVPNASNTPANYIDPAAQFAAGGTSITFTIPKGSTTATLPGDGMFSPGTVAGVLTLTLTTLDAGTQNILPDPAPSKSFTIGQTAPAITTGSVIFTNASSSGFTIELTGFSTTREIKTATLVFTSTQTISGGSTATVDVTSVFNTYFASAAGIANGGTFKLDLPFTISGGDASIVTGVTVTLTNSVGASTTVSGSR